MYARALGFLEEMSWLESLGHRLDTLQPVSDQRSVMDLLHGRWLGDALHPVLSELPSGFRAPCLCSTPSGTTVGPPPSPRQGVQWRSRRPPPEPLLDRGRWPREAPRPSPRIGQRRWARPPGRVSGGASAGAASCRRTPHSHRARSERAAAFVGGELVFGRGLMIDTPRGRLGRPSGPPCWTTRR